MKIRFILSLALPLVFYLSSCNDFNSIIKLIVLGNRIERMDNKNEANESNNNSWGLSKIIKIDTLESRDYNYSIDLLLPADTSNSIKWTIRALPKMINDFQFKENIFKLNFYKDTLKVFSCKIQYELNGNNGFTYKLYN